MEAPSQVVPPGSRQTLSNDNTLGEIADSEPIRLPDLATLFASVGAPPPDGSNAGAARPFDALLDGRRIREDLGFRPQFPRLADAMAAGA